MSGAFQPDDVWELLSSGGAEVTRELNEDGTARLSMTKYNPLFDPSGAMRIGGFLAGSATDLEPNVIVAWQELEDALLAFAVAAELGIPVIRVFDVEGLIRYEGDFPTHARGVVVIDAVRDYGAVEALKTLFGQRASVLCGVVSVVRLGTSVADGSLTSLVSASDRPEGAGA